jgi:hypothetical protein
LKDIKINLHKTLFSFWKGNHLTELMSKKVQFTYLWSHSVG